MRSAPAIGFEYQPSRWVPRILGVVVVLAAMATWFCGAPLAARITLVAVTLASGAWGAHRLRRPPIYAVGWSGQSGWTVRGLDGADDTAVLASFRVVRQVVLLRLMTHRYGTFTLWLAPDNSDADTRRRLRMRLAVLHAPKESAM